MPILTVVGPSSIEKSYIASQVVDRIGPQFSTLIKSPQVGLSENASAPTITEDEVISWAFNVIHGITDPTHLYVFDGFPLPDSWIQNKKAPWTLQNKNLEIRMSFKKAAQIVAIPLSWKNWQATAIHKQYMNSEQAQTIRNNYERYLRFTILPSYVLNMQGSVLADINSITRELGLIID